MSETPQNKNFKSPLADLEMSYGDVKIRLLQPLMISRNGVAERWPAGTWSVNEACAKVLLAQGRIMANSRGAVAELIEDEEPAVDPMSGSGWGWAGS